MGWCYALRMSLPSLVEYWKKLTFHVHFNLEGSTHKSCIRPKYFILVCFFWPCLTSTIRILAGIPKINCCCWDSVNPRVGIGVASLDTGYMVQAFISAFKVTYCILAVRSYWTMLPPSTAMRGIGSFSELKMPIHSEGWGLLFCWMKRLLPMTSSLSHTRCHLVVLVSRRPNRRTALIPSMNLSWLLIHTSLILLILALCKWLALVLENSGPIVLKPGLH